MTKNTIPYGYRIQNGRAVIEEKEARILRELCKEYLSGISIAAAAQKVGLEKNNSSIRVILKNKHYLGDEFFPAILDWETFEAVEAERQMRSKDKVVRNGRHKPKLEIITRFEIQKSEMNYEDPYKQAEYIYSLIGKAERRENESSK